MIGVLLENKKKTYAQYRMIEDIFFDCLSNMDLFEKDDFEKNVTYSRWCTGDRPIPKEILSFYDNAGFDGIQNNIQDDVIPNLINVPATRELLLELVADSVDVIGTKKADEFARITDDAELITALIRYAILNDHDSKHTLLSPDLSDILLSNRLPSANCYFIGRKEELKAVAKALQDHNPVFITGTAGMGKSELVKTYAKKNEKKYTNIIHLFYGGDLKKCVAHMEFSDDTADMSEEMLFDKHMRILKKLHSDSLIIIDNFNVLPKEDAFFKEFIKLNCKILVTSRCNISQYETIKISEMDADTELIELFYKHCPSAKSSQDVVKEIIQTVGCHTLTVCLSALSLTASGMEPEELLAELKTCGLNITSGEDVELYKDDDFTDGLMIEHLSKLLQLGKLSNQQLDILRNLSLLPVSGVIKNSFKNWMKLDNLTDVNHLIKYGFINEDTDNKKISLHPLLQEVIAIETMPTVTACSTLLDNLHLICLAHGLELRRPENVIASLISVTERIIVDDGAYFLLFLQDVFPYLDKYLVSDYLPKLTERISYVMEEYKLESPCDKALLLDYKAECFLLKKDYGNAVKKREKAINIMEKLHTKDADMRTTNLLSNLYNNLSNTYLLMKQGNEAAKALRTAFNIRIEYAHLGLTESHDSLQQMMNLINMLLLAKDVDNAKIVLEQYETLVLEHLSDTSLDYGICKLSQGIIDMMERKPEAAEINLLGAESIIGNAVGTDNDYMRTTYRYLNNLYARWKKPEKAIEYRDKFLGVNRGISRTKSSRRR
ncbi:MULTISPECIES: AAA family ATPase [Lachnospiraceae]|uniref:AAA family ATPase n=1 Tax=Lachnospiraceae TaxID=186803 RepID=UPI001FAAD080|nr:AAA family ATPase [Blautia sp. OM05-6]